MAPVDPTKTEKDDGVLQAIRYSRGSLDLLDQRLLPHKSEFIAIKSTEDCWHAIKDMAVRGAPAIAISAALSLAAALANRGSPDNGYGFAGPQEAAAYISDQLDYLVSSRPTAVNVAKAAAELKSQAKDGAGSAASGTAGAAAVVEAFISSAEAMLSSDVASNKAIGQHGAAAVLQHCASRPRGAIRMLTHCNTGSLATAKYGTALGVIRALFADAALQEVFCTETRPYNQGARLTAFELVHEKIPSTLVCDSATAYLMAQGRVDAVVVGADRITNNGDTANKVGTYMLAVAARAHNIPFFVAAPLTTIDTSLETGQEIVIEQRPAKEVTHTHGGYGERLAAEGIEVWNPGFDITPAEFITAIVTDVGVATKSGSSFDLRKFIAGHLEVSAEPSAKKVKV
eukprot:jgi/Mesvir1/848/Mv17421-RA.1